VAVFGLAVASAAGVAYRHFVDRWGGSLRGPLIAAASAGMLFIVVAPTLVGREGGEP
jgi:hypothetical protein